jgi:hypothetical protein
VKYLGLLLWVFAGYLVAMAVLDWRGDAQLAVMSGCLATSVLQRFYTVSGKWKGDAWRQ